MEFPWGNIWERGKLEELDVGERVILKWIYNILIGGEVWIGLI
jgi:hypothetical protein